MARPPQKLTNSLTDSQKKHAKAIGTSNVEYKEHLTNRLKEMTGKVLPATFRDPKLVRDKVEAVNPVLIVGAGPSYAKNIEAIKNFKGIIIFVDVIFNEMVSKHLIIPDYVCTLEYQVHPDFFRPKNIKLCLDKSVLICSSITLKSIFLQCEATGFKYKRWKDDFQLKEEARFSNVGTFSICYAKEVLKADKIFLVGFEHDGVEQHQNTWKYWQIDFWYFVRKWEKELIVNCTDGGALYYADYILDSTLDSLVVK